MMSASSTPEARGMLAMLSRLIHDERARNIESGNGRLVSLFALATLVGAIPTDVRVRAINHVVTIAAPELFDRGLLIEAITTWPGGNADAFLTELRDIAVDEARRVFAARPERAMAYRNFRQRFQLPDLIGIAE